MFELLLIIYLLPVLIIGMLLLKLVFWLFEDFHTSGCMAG